MLTLVWLAVAKPYKSLVVPQAGEHGLYGNKMLAVQLAPLVSLLPLCGSPYGIESGHSNDVLQCPEVLPFAIANLRRQTGNGPPKLVL